MSLSNFVRTSSSWCPSLDVTRARRPGAPTGRRAGQSGGNGHRPVRSVSDPFVQGCQLAPGHQRAVRLAAARRRFLSGGPHRVPGHRPLLRLAGFSALNVTSGLPVLVASCHEADDAVIWLPARRTSAQPPALQRGTAAFRRRMSAPDVLRRVCTLDGCEAGSIRLDGCSRMPVSIEARTQRR
jgi:hypothetical protein